MYASLCTIIYPAQVTRLKTMSYHDETVCFVQDSYIYTRQGCVTSYAMLQCLSAWVAYVVSGSSVRKPWTSSSSGDGGSDDCGGMLLVDVVGKSN
jgi:hypothetical protein